MDLLGRYIQSGHYLCSNEVCICIFPSPMFFGKTISARWYFTLINWAYDSEQTHVVLVMEILQRRHKLIFIESCLRLGPECIQYVAKIYTYKQICTVIIELFLLTQDCSLLYLHFLSCSSTWILKAFLIWNTKLGPGFGWHSSVPSIWQECRTLVVVLLFSLLLPSCSDFRNKMGSNKLAGDDDGSKIYIKKNNPPN